MSGESSMSPLDRRRDEIIAAYLQVVDAGQAPDRQRLLDENPDRDDWPRFFFAARCQARPAQIVPYRPLCRAEHSHFNPAE